MSHELAVEVAFCSETDRSTDPTEDSKSQGARLSSAYIYLFFFHRAFALTFDSMVPQWSCQTEGCNPYQTLPNQSHSTSSLHIPTQTAEVRQQLPTFLAMLGNLIGYGDYMRRNRGTAAPPTFKAVGAGLEKWL